jgi:hypothetical protein
VLVHGSSVIWLVTEKLTIHAQDSSWNVQIVWTVGRLWVPITRCIVYQRYIFLMNPSIQKLWRVCINKMAMLIPFYTRGVVTIRIVSIIIINRIVCSVHPIPQKALFPLIQYQLLFIHFHAKCKIMHAPYIILKPPL